MAGLDPPARPKPLRRGEGPAIHDLLCRSKNVDARDKPGMTTSMAGCFTVRCALTRLPCPGTPPRSWSSASPR
ncbi:hypothetical protein C7U89_25420 [Bradyrhizobium sp. WBOS4]|nr:hypothetical protein [Bradyrhizobium sp. WBOS8]MDD1586250.1 hypothetical protein [Bradyrhizobium sp. WBOS4]UUO47052.1 hypothetical protein DCM78_09050 [Bradyrhizobium sp. WBOS04]UUO60669.1 hypothetical protein DCM80_16790 [Bradyrhizobium sp. WBOS08]